MNWFYLHPWSLLALSQSILAFFVALYLVSIRHKTRAAWMLALFMGAFGLLWASEALVLSIPNDALVPFNLDVLDAALAPLVLFGFLHFSYAFLDNPFPRESTWVFRGTLAFVVINACYQGYLFLSRTAIPDGYELMLECVHFTMIAWTLGILLRKKARLTTAGGGWTRIFQTESRETRALRAFSVLTLMIILVTLRGVGMALMDWQGWPNSSHYLAYTVLLLSFVVVYINHASEPTTFLIKLVGLSLATLLTVLGLAALLLYPDAALRRASQTALPEVQSLRFERDEAGAYRKAAVPLPFDADLGTDLGVGVEGDTLVALGFAFPFYDASWDAMYIDANGLVTFGDAYRATQFHFFFDSELPKIAPYYRALVPLASAESGVYYKPEADRVTVTWYRVRERYDEQPDNENTIQLVLHQDGTIDFVYDRMEALPFYGLRGLHPGGPEPRWDEQPFGAPATTITEALLPKGQTIRFEAETNSDYRFASIPARFDAALGEDLALGNMQVAAVPLGFAFPFFEAAWDSVFISDNGLVSFGRSVYPDEPAWFNPSDPLYAEVPLIAPLFDDLNPGQGGAVFYKTDTDKATITWHDVPDLGQRYTNTVQLVLHRTGTIDFTYAHVGMTAFAADLWGLYPGAEGTPVDPLRYLTATNAFQGTPGAGMAENFFARADQAFLAYRHGRMIPFLYVILGSTLFVLVIFPVLFRISLVRPLAALLGGVRRVDGGDLGARVPVRVNDEIGTLAQGFNRMAASLQVAEKERQTYAESLEHKVEERTQHLKEALRDLKAAQQQLIHAEKMASLGQLTAGIAHEIKNPLNFVNNFAVLSRELIDEIEEETDPEEIQAILDDLKVNAGKIEEHGKRADGIVHAMMQHAATGTGQREPTNLNHLISEHIDLAYHGKRAQVPDLQVAIRKDLGDDVRMVEVMPQEIGRVMLNLLGNAFDAVIERSTQSDGTYEPTVRVVSCRKENAIEIRVSDNGPGIPEEIREKIFEPFFTTKPTGSGTGLGLSLSYDIITQGHGGTLTVERTAGKGAAFIITLPNEMN